MKQRLQISIPQACSQNWDAMSLATDGNYCSSCQKQVKDFSTFSNVGLQQWFQLHVDEKSCGRFTQAQLAPGKADPLKINPLTYLKSKLIIALLLALPIFTKASSSRVLVNDSVEVRPFSSTTKATPDQKKQNLPTDQARKLRGVVLDSDGKTTVPNASVEIKGTNKRVLTDQKGNFEIDLSGLDPAASQLLVVSFIGFQTVEQKLDLQAVKPLTIILSEMIMGEICIKRPNIFQRIIGVFKK